MKTDDNVFKYMTVVVCTGLIILVYIIVALLGDKASTEVSRVSAKNVSELFLKRQIAYYNVPLDTETQDYILEIAKKYGVRPELILAVIDVESSFREDVISKTNDYGLMGINICNHDEMRMKLGITDFLDAKQNIHCGVHILSSHLKYTGSIEKALMCYNCGVTGARRLWKRGIVSTRYSRKVMEKYEKYVMEGMS